MKTRIWCEFAPPKEVCRDKIVEVLKKYDVTLNYKLEYGQNSEDFFSMIKTYNEAGVLVSIWATLSDEMGYWINERNAHHFDEYVRNLVQTLEERQLKVSGICIDMETPLDDIIRLAKPKFLLDPCLTYGKMLTDNLNKKRYMAAKQVLLGTANFLKEKGLEGYATCIRHCYYDIRFNSEVFQNALEIPVFDIEWDKYNLMYYATMIRSEMKKIKRVSVDYLIYHQVSHLKKKLKDKLAISVGVTNIGKLGNEPYYESMEEFTKDIGILKECGVDDFSLFSLDGIMDGSRLEDFLCAMKEAKPYKPELCKRVLRNEFLTAIAVRIIHMYYKLIL